MRYVSLQLCQSFHHSDILTSTIPLHMMPRHCTANANKKGTTEEEKEEDNDDNDDDDSEEVFEEEAENQVTLFTMT